MSVHLVQDGTLILTVDLCLANHTPTWWPNVTPLIHSHSFYHSSSTGSDHGASRFSTFRRESRRGLIT